jgi:hypothetical protein
MRSEEGGKMRRWEGEANAEVAMKSKTITPAVKYPKFVIPAQAGIQKNTGCRIKSGMTELAI